MVWLTPPRAWCPRLKPVGLFEPSKVYFAGRVLHNNVMYQDAADGNRILNVNASILEAEIEYRRQFLAKEAGEANPISLRRLTNSAAALIRT